MRKILLATPLKGDLCPEYVRTLVALMSARVPDTKFLYAFLGGCSVQWARDELVAIARQHGLSGDDKICYWDKDLEPEPAHILRICSHDEMVVCGVYAKRELATFWHAHGIQGGEPDARGLQPLEKGAIGFSAIKMKAFDMLIEKFPERAYWKIDAGENMPPVHLHEFFPMGIVGPNSHVGKLKRISDIVKGRANNPENAITYPEAVVDRYSDIIDVLKDTDYSGNQMRGEDYYFCELCREAGIPLWLDTNVIVPHKGENLFPIMTKDLLAMLDEPWRADEIRALQAAKPKTDEEIVPT